MPVGKAYGKTQGITERTIFIPVLTVTTKLAQHVQSCSNPPVGRAHDITQTTKEYAISSPVLTITTKLGYHIHSCPNIPTGCVYDISRGTTEGTIMSPGGTGTTKSIGGDNADYDMIGLFSCRVYMAENRQQWYIGARLKM